MLPVVTTGVVLAGPLRFWVREFSYVPSALVFNVTRVAFGPPEGRRSDKMPSVCMSVCMYVCVIFENMLA